MWAGLTPDSKGDPTGDTEEPDRRRHFVGPTRSLYPLTFFRGQERWVVRGQGRPPLSLTRTVEV